MEELRYFIKKPRGRRKTFALVCYTLNGDRRQYAKLPDELLVRVTTINAQYLNKTVTVQQATVLMKDMITAQYRKLNVRDMVIRHSELSVINQRVFSAFWKKEYEPRELVSPRSARYDFQKAIRLIEPLSLATAEEWDLKPALRASGASVPEIRRAIARLNQIFKFLGRGFRLHKPAEGLRTIRYVTEGDLNKLLSHFETGPVKDLIVTLFCSGLRLSESMALTPQDLQDGGLMVTKQLTELGELKRPKRGKQGRVFVLPWGLEAATRWCAVEGKEQYRVEVQRLLLGGAKRWLGRRLSPHDLRHSHAIHLLGKGASLTQVALNLRNRVEVCQKYYTGFAHTSDTLDALKVLIK